MSIFEQESVFGYFIEYLDVDYDEVDEVNELLNSKGYKDEC